MTGSNTPTAPTAPGTAFKVAGAASVALGVGFGVPCAYGIWYLVRHQSNPQTRQRVNLPASGGSGSGTREGGRHAAVES